LTTRRIVRGRAMPAVIRRCLMVYPAYPAVLDLIWSLVRPNLRSRDW